MTFIGLAAFTFFFMMRIARGELSEEAAKAAGDGDLLITLIFLFIGFKIILMTRIISSSLGFSFSSSNADAAGAGTGAGPGLLT